MIKLVALYKKPDDVDAFMQRYLDVHIPLVRKTPGLLNVEVTRVTADTLGGEPPYFLITTMTYPDGDTFRSAMQSEEAKAARDDARASWKGLLTVLVCEDVH
jgi:uncharacterized protein (TIGR02118 family)